MEKDNDGLLLRPILPPDIVIKTAFFISDWPTLIKFLISLRPADNLGPLEQLLQLRWLGRPGPSLWPQLGVLWSNEKEREHLEQIAKYYSRIVVNPCQVDPEWLGQFSTERASVSWIGSPHEELKDAVVKVSSREFYCKWAQYCVAGFEFYGHFLGNSIEVLDHMNNLVEVSAVGCSQTVFSAVAAFAGRSRSLRVLILSTMHGGLTLFCTLTEDMVENLVQWITSQPIQGVHLTGFVCENDDLRSKLILALVKSTSLEQLTLKKMNLNLVPFLIQLNAPKLRYLNLNDCFLKIQELASQLLESNIEVLSLSKNYQESSLESLFEAVLRMET
ncbi:hypothetical protein AeMF1_008193 [Aphanomyces euteiches]|nr:hypothetical protein AeMF1_008193 [Aphanomyces euteiches]